MTKKKKSKQTQKDVRLAIIDIKRNKRNAKSLFTQC